MLTYNGDEDVAEYLYACDTLCVIHPEEASEGGFFARQDGPCWFMVVSERYHTAARLARKKYSSPFFVF